MHAKRRLNAFRLGAFVLMALWPLFGQSQGLPGFKVSPSAGGQTYSLEIELLVLLTSLTFLPAIVLMMTSFTRIIIVLSLLRMAMGTQGTPPNQVLVGLALFLSLFVMSPTLEKIQTQAYEPLAAKQITMMQALQEGSKPLREFMLRQTREQDVALFNKLANGPALKDPQDISFKILVPAFVTSELKTAFQIGFAIFIPFLIIDMVIASVLMSMGMMMISPAIVALPFKIMLFVLVDGWQLLLGSLAQSFGS